MSAFAEGDLTQDAFLGGGIRLWQPRKGYRAGIDPVLLAASVPARSGQSVLELGCGAGAAMLCLAHRVTGMRLTGVELQASYATLARQNAAENAIEAAIHEANLEALPGDVRQMRFDHVIANPPYYRANAHSKAADEGRSIALGEDTPLRVWIDVAARRLAPKGYLHVIHKVDRLPDLLAACADRVGSIEILPLSARASSAPDLMILRARKEGRAAFRLHPACVLHSDAVSPAPQEKYHDQIEQVLRHAAALTWPGGR